LLAFGLYPVGRANSRRTDLAHEMYREIDAVKPIFLITAISQLEYNQYAITTVLQFKIFSLSYLKDLLDGLG